MQLSILVLNYGMLKVDPLMMILFFPVHNVHFRGKGMGFPGNSSTL